MEKFYNRTDADIFNGIPTRLSKLDFADKLLFSRPTNRTRKEILMSRKLASIVTVKTKSKMFEKDRICVVSFEELGYEAIVPTSVNVGDKMVFIQEGSILPVDQKWEFLRKRCFKESLNGFLIKPMMIGARDNNGEKGEKVQSWGLCITLVEAGLDDSYNSGDDVTKELKIRKYEEDSMNSRLLVEGGRLLRFLMKHKITRWIGCRLLDKSGSIGRAFPTEYISKSDETTIQNCPEVFKKFAETPAYVTAKLEGQSFTVSLKHNKMILCSRNSALRDDANGKIFYGAARKYDIEKKLKAYKKKTGDLLCIQGEQCGPGIQGNIYDLTDVEWFAFRVRRLHEGKWSDLTYEEFKPIVERMGLCVVPLIEKVTDMSKFDSVESLVNYAAKQYWIPSNMTYSPTSGKLWKDYLQHEGIVVKSIPYDKEQDIGFSFKVKNMSYQEKDYKEMNKIARNLRKQVLKKK